MGVRADASHAVAVVFVVDAVAYGVHLVPERVQRAPVGSDVDVAQRVQQADAEHDGVEAESAVVVLGTGASLHEGEEVGHVVGELRVGGGRAVVVVDGAVVDGLGERGVPASYR